MKKLKAFIIYILVLALCAAVFFFTKNYYSSQKEIIVQEVEKEKIVEVEKAIVVSGETIQSGINNIGKLCTAEYYFEHVENFKDKLTFKNGTEIPLTTTSFIYSYDGKITAGIDFESVIVQKNDDLKTITITVPKADIISSEVDEDSFKLYDQKNNIFNRASISDFAISFADLIKSEEDKAISSGLLDRAQDNASSIIKNFISATYDLKEYTVNVKVA